MAQTEKKRKGKKKTDGLLNSPLCFHKHISEEKQKSFLESTPTKIDSSLHNNFKDPNRDRELTDNTLLIRPEAPKRKFNLKEPTWDEIKTTGSTSAPGPNDVP